MNPSSLTSPLAKGVGFRVGANPPTISTISFKLGILPTFLPLTRCATNQRYEFAIARRLPVCCCMSSRERGILIVSWPEGLERVAVRVILSGSTGMGVWAVRLLLAASGASGFLSESLDTGAAAILGECSRKSAELWVRSWSWICAGGAGLAVGECVVDPGRTGRCFNRTPVLRSAGGGVAMLAGVGVAALGRGDGGSVPCIGVWSSVRRGVANAPAAEVGATEAYFSAWRDATSTLGSPLADGVARRPLRNIGELSMRESEAVFIGVLVVDYIRVVGTWADDPGIGVGLAMVFGIVVGRIAVVD